MHRDGQNKKHLAFGWRVVVVPRHRTVELEKQRKFFGKTDCPWLDVLKMSALIECETITLTSLNNHK